MAIFNDIFVVFLIVMTAFFVASEFAIVAIRKPTVRQLVVSGNPRAKYVEKVTANMNDYLAACQLGNTLAALAMGWVGEATMRGWLQPLFDMLPLPESVEGPIAIFTSFILITFLNVVLGELAPKTFTIHSTEKVAMFIARPLIWWYYITFPLNWLLNHSANLITRMFGVTPDNDMDRMTPTELKIVFEDSYQQGLLNPQEFRYMQNIFKLDDVPAQEVMIPRTKMITISKSDTVQDLLELTARETYHIFPVTEERDKDHIIGMLQVSVVMAGLGRDLAILEQPIEKFMTPIMQVFEGMKLQELLFKMQQEGQSFVILTDEYGGTSGLITLEDVMEIIVGDMEEVTAPKGIRKVAEGHFVIEGNEPLISVEEELSIELSAPGVHTLSGWLLYQQFDLETGDFLEESGWRFTIRSMNKNSIRQIEAIKTNKEASEL
ncbi:HlyC/CorC family transporter [Listeria weihenstephanensis]|uniref:HlyC/CorC family transporter n=1 Tax=Listeria weihenstephanensis TaxID=1006155 RepID=A0A841Z7Q9_9LIST|nr:hemolysin family protein [Listeria weihenstephanensis]MBC1500373.1 HlyC/CorC family transporter [Listeria weihenstephanensis]